MTSLQRESAVGALNSPQKTASMPQVAMLPHTTTDRKQLRNANHKLEKRKQAQQITLERETSELMKI